MTLKEKILHINQILAVQYPTPLSALNWSTPWQMLVAAVLSAQTTDVMVNKVTDVLFQKYPTVQDFNNTDIDELMRFTQRINYFRNKTSYLKEDARIIIEKYNGEVPDSLEELIELKGIGRKVANVIIGDVFKKPVGIVVDTHVKRVSYRLGLTKNTDPVKIEQDLMVLLPQQEWVNISHRLIFHGRNICIARFPKCEICPLKEICDYYKKNL